MGNWRTNNPTLPWSSSSRKDLAPGESLDLWSMVPCLNSDYKGETSDFQSGSLPAVFGWFRSCFDLKAVPCWVLNFCDKPLNLFRNFSFYGVRMRTCYARPEIVYILSREDRLILRKEGFLAKLFIFTSQSWRRVCFPAGGLDFDFGSLHSTSQSLNFWALGIF